MNKPATEATKAYNSSFLPLLENDDRQDFADSRRGLVEEVRDLQIRDDAGRLIWDMKAYYDFCREGAPCPDTVNPSLWRQEQLNTIAGLFEVCDGIWQVRGYDLANMNIIRSDTGYIIIDACTSIESARAALELFFRHFEKKPIRGVIVTHSHADHFGGVAGVIDPADAASGKIPLVAPAGFMEEAVSENVYAGQAMKRRGLYQFGGRLPIGPMGHVGVGAAKGTPKGTTSLIRPNTIIERTGQTLTIDGVDFVFQMTPETEAPSGLCVYLPQFRALCMADIVIYTMHNLLPIRGAKVRSAALWARYLDEALHLFGDRTDVLFICHNWPRWGKEAVTEVLKCQRDAYRYINDQVVRQIRHGRTMHEIAEDLRLPEALARKWYLRDYYGALRHNARAVYQWYLGWYDGVPAHLDPLPPEEAGRRYVELMGGQEETLRKGREILAGGDCRWAAEVLNHLVFGYPDNAAARELLADTYEQLGWQAESGTWRNSYLTAAKELREGPFAMAYTTVTARTLQNLPLAELFSYLAGMVDPARCGEKPLLLNVDLEDGTSCSLALEHCALNFWPARDAAAQAACAMSRATLDRLAGRELTVGQAVARGLVTETGEPGVLAAIFDAFEELPDFAFNIVTP
ncbi:MAG: alkyl sulfatase dimerization domain-containing protein [Desulfovibrionaceae bacterium]|nr:alkyl sulfatase dimerization domain-containing protein [Desulfovibrionaceae bacterium]